MDITQIEPRDRQQYFSDTVIFDKISGEAVYVHGVDGRLALISKVGSTARPKSIPIEELQDRFILYRPRLGWRNSSNACIFGSTTPGRGYKKTYSMGEIKVFSPIYSSISELYQKLHYEWLSSIQKRGELQDRMPDNVRNMKQVVQALSDISPKTTHYLRVVGSGFFNKRDAIESLSKDRVGVAINSYWALIQMPNNSEYTATMFRNRTSVGSINIHTGEMSLSRAYTHLQPEWDRLS